MSPGTCECWNCLSTRVGIAEESAAVPADDTTIHNGDLPDVNLYMEIFLMPANVHANFDSQLTAVRPTAYI